MKVYLNGVNVVIERGAPFLDIAIPSTDSRVIEWNMSDDLGIHDEINQETYKANYADIFDENGVSYGANKQEVKDALELFVGEVPNGGGGVPPTNETIVNLLSGQIVTTTVDESEFRHLVVAVPIPPSQLIPTGTLDNGNVSSPSVEAALIDGDYNSICYNDTSAGTVNKELPALDLGVATPVNQIKVYWWQGQFVANDFKIQSSNDGISWTDELTGLVGLANVIQGFPVNATKRYWRIFCVVGNNGNFCVIRELEAFGVPLGDDKFINHGEDKVTIKVDGNGKIVLINNTTENITVTIKH